METVFAELLLYGMLIAVYPYSIFPRNPFYEYLAPKIPRLHELAGRIGAIIFGFLSLYVLFTGKGLEEATWSFRLALSTLSLIQIALVKSNKSPESSTNREANQ